NSPVWSCKPNKIESFLKSKEKNEKNRIFIIIMENSSEYLSDIKGWMKKNNLKAIFLDEYFTVQKITLFCEIKIILVNYKISRQRYWWDIYDIGYLKY
ncbi:hypothetical protein, partial [Escherichia coli]|uniref:hypothetical protein n=1 Tax=Escherichia coli TaxID=562 RepID=UPI00131A1D70